MKKLLLFFAFLSLSLHSQAQTLDTLPWCPPGAMWVYSYGAIGTRNAYVLRYVEDTIIQGLISKKISIHENVYMVDTQGNIAYEQSNTFIRNEFLYKDQDSVFKYNFDSSKFEKQYVFSQAQNDSWSLASYDLFACSGSDMSPNIVEVDTLRLRTYGNWSIQTADLRLAPNWEVGDFMYRNIGPSGSFFARPTSNNCTSGYARRPADFLTCYSDSLRGIVTFRQNTTCPYITPLDYVQGPKPQSASQSQYTLYPNPAASRLFLKHDLGQMALARYSLHNALGQEIGVWQGNFPQEGFSLEGLQQGFYFLSIQEEGSAQAFTFKFVKH